MKTLKTIVAVLAITSITSASFGQSLLDKAKDAAKKNGDKGKETSKDLKKKKGGKGSDNMAVKGSGVSQATTPVSTSTTTTTGGK